MHGKTRAFDIRTSILVLLGMLLVTQIAVDNVRADPAGAPQVSAASSVDAGRYLVLVGGCNDCHTGGWAESAGGVPETEWLTGVPMGFRGPWGTTYPSNLRLLVQDMDEEAWVVMLHTRTERPPMPWMNMNRLSDADARALYRFIRSLGVAGQRAPTAVAPGVEPETPYILFEPLHLERMPGGGAKTAQP